MAKLNPYLNFPGTAEEAFTFYKSVFGGEFTALQRMGETPHGAQLPEAEKNKIMHVALPVGDSVIMATDALESMNQKLAKGNNMYITFNASGAEEGERVFKGLSEGAEVEMPLQKMFWGDYFASLTDRFGIKWMIVYPDKQA